MKYLVLLAVAWIAFNLLRGRLRSRPAGHTVPPRNAKTEDMVRCAQCGLHLPRSESLLAHGSVYCCVEHQRRHGGGD